MVKFSPLGQIKGGSFDSPHADPYLDYLGVAQMALSLRGTSVERPIAIPVPRRFREFLACLECNPNFDMPRDFLENPKVAGLVLTSDEFYEIANDYVTKHAEAMELAFKLDFTTHQWMCLLCSFDKNSGERQRYLDKEVVVYFGDVQSPPQSLDQIDREPEYLNSRKGFRVKNLVFLDRANINKTAADDYSALTSEASSYLFERYLASFIETNQITLKDYQRVCGIDWKRSAFEMAAKNWIFARNGDTSDFQMEATYQFTEKTVKPGDGRDVYLPLLNGDLGEVLANQTLTNLSVKLGAGLNTMRSYISNEKYADAALIFLYIISEMEFLDIGTKNAAQGAAKGGGNPVSLVGIFADISVRLCNDSGVSRAPSEAQLKEMIERRLGNIQDFATWAHNLIDKVYHNLFYSDAEREGIFKSRQQELDITLPPVADIKAPHKKPTIGVSQLNNDPSIDPRELIYDRLSCKISLCSITGQSVNLSWEKEFVLENQLFPGMFHDGEDETCVPFIRACEILRDAGEHLGIPYGKIYDCRERDGHFENHDCEFDPRSPVPKTYLGQKFLEIRGVIKGPAPLSLSTSRFAIYNPELSARNFWDLLETLKRDDKFDRDFYKKFLIPAEANRAHYAEIAGVDRRKYGSIRVSHDEIFTGLVNSNSEDSRRRTISGCISKSGSTATDLAPGLIEDVSRNLGGLLLQIEEYIVNYRIKDAKLAFLNFIFHEDHYYRLQNDQKIISPERKSCASFTFLELAKSLKCDPRDVKLKIKELEQDLDALDFVIAARRLLKDTHDRLFYSEQERRELISQGREPVVSTTERDADSPKLTVIVPAFNEADRIRPPLQGIIKYLDARGAPYEVIVVDDGSEDNTAGLVNELAKQHPQVRCVRVEKNTGKGNAVRIGMRLAKGELVLFTDADGATPIEELEKLQRQLTDGGLQIAIGSRASDGTGATQVDSTWWRRAVGRVFNFAVSGALLSGVKDTQCGFKLFTSEAAKFLSAEQRSDGYSFDVELLYMARRVEMLIGEVSVNWHDRPGSKVKVWRDGMKMFLDLLKFRFQHRDINPEQYQKYRKVRREIGAHS